MGWLGKLLGKGGGETIAKIGGVVERFAANHLGKKELMLEIEKLLHEREMAQTALLETEIGAKERIMVAELQQGDAYTKRARPTIVYVGLVGAIVDSINTIDFTLPEQFWWAWGSVVGVYGVGRSIEKATKNGNGGIGALARKITGSSKILGD